MDLRRYLDSRQLEYKEFAKMLGITSTALSNYLCGRRRPALAIAQKIIELTKGKVTNEDLLKNWREKNERTKIA